MREDINHRIELECLPFDSHVHFRDPSQGIFEAVVPITASQCWGAVVMPNTNPFITTPEMAVNYAGSVRAITGDDFKVVMTGYLTEKTEPDSIVRGYQTGAWKAMKAYPKGLTTNSHGGIANILLCHDQLQAMEDVGMPLLLHGEKADYEVDGRLKKADIYDRSRYFVEDVLGELLARYPALPKSLEHVSSRPEVEFMFKHGGERMVCTSTVQHALLDRNDFFAEGPDVHLHCYPVLKRVEDRDAVAELTTSGLPFVSAGTDSAPHPTTAKERACGCAGGVFTAHAMVSLYTEIFDRKNKLQHLEGFLCINGPRFFGLEPQKGEMHIVKNGRPGYSGGLIKAGKHHIRPFGYHELPGQARPFPWRVTHSSIQRPFMEKPSHKDYPA